MTELNVFANQEKLVAEGEEEDDDDDDDYDAQADSGVYNDDVSEGSRDSDESVGRGGIDTAARVASDAVDNQHYNFERGSRERGRGGSRDNDEDDRISDDEEIRNSQRESPDRPTDRVSRKDVYGDTAHMRYERVRLLAKLKRQQLRLPEIDRVRINPNMTLEQLREKSLGSSYESRARQAVLFMRRGTVAFTKIVTFISNLFPQFRGLLDKWTENVYLTLDQYDDMLYDIYDEYGDAVSMNPIFVFVMALGSNAVMFAMTQKFMQNPLAGQVMENIAAAVLTQQQEQQARRTGTNTNPVRGNSSSAPPTLDNPAVRPHASDIVGHESGGPESTNPMNDLGSLLGGLDLGKLLGNLDLGSMMSNMGQASTGDQAHSRSTGPPVVNEMEGPSMNTQGLLSELRAREDSSRLQTVDETAPSSNVDAPVADTQRVREVNLDDHASKQTRLSFE
jgi:hypothetical protein